MLEIMMKITENKIEEVLDECQFRRGREAIDAIGKLIILAERMNEQGRTQYACFVYYGKSVEITKKILNN